MLATSARPGNTQNLVESAADAKCRLSSRRWSGHASEVPDLSVSSSPAAGRGRAVARSAGQPAHGLLPDVVERGGRAPARDGVRDGAGPAGVSVAGHRRGVVPIRRLALHRVEHDERRAAAAGRRRRLVRDQPREPAGRAGRGRRHPRNPQRHLDRAHTQGRARQRRGDRAGRGSRRHAVDGHRPRAVYPARRGVAEGRAAVGVSRGPWSRSRSSPAPATCWWGHGGASSAYAQGHFRAGVERVRVGIHEDAAGTIWTTDIVAGYRRLGAPGPPGIRSKAPAIA